MIVGGLADGVFGLLVPLQLDENGVSASAIGTVLSVGAAIFLVGSTLLARLGDRAVRLQVGAAGSLLLAVSIVPVLLSSAAGAVVTSALLRALPAFLLYTICFPLGANGAHRAGIGRGAVIGLLNLGVGKRDARSLRSPPARSRRRQEERVAVRRSWPPSASRPQPGSPAPGNARSAIPGAAL